VTTDAWLLAVLLVSFATLATAHVAIAAGLARRVPRWRALVVLVVVPLAPWWGLRERMRVRAAVWIGAAVAYAVSLWLASP
jgi:hypothetical protein